MLTMLERDERKEGFETLNVPDLASLGNPVNMCVGLIVYSI
jgi:hypothetical protein